MDIDKPLSLEVNSGGFGRHFLWQKKMSLEITINLEITRTILDAWHNPNPRVGGGFDGRSSDSGLLVTLYGSLEKASRYHWLNAGRTLVDKTYLGLLLQAKDINIVGVTQHDMSPVVELFVRQQLIPIWNELNQPISEERANLLAVNLVEIAANDLFGSEVNERAASWLLFYLCPQLPIFPMTHSVSSIEHYKQHHQQSSTQYVMRKLALTPEELDACYGGYKEHRLIEHVLLNSNWWQRYWFISTAFCSIEGDGSSQFHPS